jgi:hypothetical protein
MFMRTIAVLVLSFGVISCQAVEQTNIVEVHITPTTYLVSQSPFTIETEAVKELMYKKPTKVTILVCMAMPTQRIIGFMNELKSKYTGPVTVGPLEQGCDKP